VRVCQPTFNAALIAYVEASRDSDGEKNHLCPPNPYPVAAVDWMAGTLISAQAQAAWSEQPDLVAWMDRSRLDAARGISEHMNEPRMQEALTRLLLNSEQANVNLTKLATGVNASP
jgi:hypothetical protein